MTRILRYIILITIWATLLFGGILSWYAWSLPNPEELTTSLRRPSVTVIGADGSVLAAYGDLYGDKVDYKDIPPFLIQAVIATEDRRFFNHYGIDAFGIFRAFFTNIRVGYIREGGSTITQQLAKNLFLTPEKSIKRKVQEAMLSFWLEAKFTKKQILTIYLNRAYLGAGTHGISAATRRYFAKSVMEINLRQASILAGLLKAPSRYSPRSNRIAAVRRGDQVLLNMVSANFLSAKMAAKIKQQSIGLAPHLGNQVLYFTDWVLDRAIGFVGQPNSDLIVRTTLQPKVQKIANSIIDTTLNKQIQSRGGTQAALVALGRGGSIRAMIGGRRYKSSQFNRVTQAQRQPGSAFKLFVYLAALEAGMKPSDQVSDHVISIDGWSPRNYDRRSRGEISLTHALAKSLNMAAVRLSEKNGRHRTVAMAERLGITTLLRSHPSIALGSSEVTLLDLTSTYAVLANGGFSSWPYGIVDIRDTAGNLLYRRSKESNRLLDPSVVNDMTRMLESAVNEGTGQVARLPVRSSGKTGTSQRFRDAWFVGFADGITTGVWVGNDRARPMKNITGGSIPARIWRDYMIHELIK
ncbi:MAG: penicillin-binding protein [Rhodospirillaceae bacterium]|nr:penicillin-binding protein [Rhodospirillaceae bacterium]|tara:strand:- start:10352 stop:12091 length:1740 start_codon:yes stop_codon:yes gene_type:complete